MAFTPIPDTVKIELLWRIDGGQTAVNVLHGNAGGVPSTTDIDALPADIRTAINVSGILDDLHPQTELVGIIVTDIHVANGYQARLEGALEVGTATGNPLPNEVALCTTLRTATNSRRGRGRVFWPGFAEIASDGQRATAGCITDVQSCIGGIMAATATNNLDLAVASYADGVSRIVTVAQTQERWDSQRRRRIPGL